MYLDLKLKKPFGLHGLYTNISASRVDHHPKKKSTHYGGLWPLVAIIVEGGDMEYGAAMMNLHRQYLVK